MAQTHPHVVSTMLWFGIALFHWHRLEVTTFTICKWKTTNSVNALTVDMFSFTKAMDVIIAAIQIDAHISPKRGNPTNKERFFNVFKTVFFRCLGKRFFKSVFLTF